MYNVKLSYSNTERFHIQKFTLEGEEFEAMNVHGENCSPMYNYFQKVNLPDGIVYATWEDEGLGSEKFIIGEVLDGYFMGKGAAYDHREEMKEIARQEAEEKIKEMEESLNPSPDYYENMAIEAGYDA